jgi:hypothetical protein
VDARFPQPRISEKQQVPHCNGVTMSAGQRCAHFRLSQNLGMGAGFNTLIVKRFMQHRFLGKPGQKQDAPHVSQKGSFLELVQEWLSRVTDARRLEQHVLHDDVRIVDIVDDENGRLTAVSTGDGAYDDVPAVSGGRSRNFWTRAPAHSTT